MMSTNLRCFADQVVGSTLRPRFQMHGDTPVLFRLPIVNFTDDGARNEVDPENETVG
jgi:hypothetical protein